MVCIVGKMAQDVGMVCRCGGVIFHLVWSVFEASIPTCACFPSENFLRLVSVAFFYCHLRMVREKKGKRGGRGEDAWPTFLFK